MSNNDETNHNNGKPFYWPFEIKPLPEKVIVPYNTATNSILGFYPDFMKYAPGRIPEPNIEVTCDEWLKALNCYAHPIVWNGKLTEGQLINDALAPKYSDAASEDLSGTEIAQNNTDLASEEQESILEEPTNN